MFCDAVRIDFLFVSLEFGVWCWRRTRLFSDAVPEGRIFLPGGVMRAVGWWFSINW